VQRVKGVEQVGSVGVKWENGKLTCNVIILFSFGGVDGSFTPLVVCKELKIWSKWGVKGLSGVPWS